MRLFLIIITAFYVSSCGFKPMLAKDNEGHRLLDEIKLSRVDGPNRLKVEKILLDSLNTHPHTAPVYDLNVSTNYETSSMAILKSSQTTRYRIKVTLNYTLVEIETKKVIDSNSLYLYSSYDVAGSDFMNYTSNRYVSDNSLKELCEELKTKLTLILSTQSEGKQH